MEIIEKTTETTVNLEYKKLEEKWNVKCCQAFIFTKIVEDLIK